jgi:hypothetical protein
MEPFIGPQRDWQLGEASPASRQKLPLFSRQVYGMRLGAERKWRPNRENPLVR